MSRSYRGLSLWFDTLTTSLAPRPSLPGAIDVDVAIVGGGFTGLWTAYYLLAADPALRVAVLEAEIAGFGASGRNGGWCSALYPVGISTLAAEAGRDAAHAQYRAMQGAVAEVVRAAAAEDIDADVAVGGTVVLARSATQLERAREEVEQAGGFGLEAELLDETQARGRVNATDVRGATYTPHCAALHPAKLVRGLADVVEARGASIYERTRVRGIERGVVHTDHGDVRAATIVRATEGYTAQLAGSKRALAPVYSLVIATEPLSEAVWDEIGLRQRETFSDFR
ncbi:MAG: FAD-dependent oxidoreductase, partial [Jatrophihabitantaceae bacterium]